MPRPFRMPAGILMSVLGVISCGALIAFLPMITMARFVIWLVIGLVVYFGYSMRHSALNKA